MRLRGPVFVCVSCESLKGLILSLTYHDGFDVDVTRRVDFDDVVEEVRRSFVFGFQSVILTYI